MYMTRSVIIYMFLKYYLQLNDKKYSVSTIKY